MERFVIDSYGPDRDAEVAAFGWLVAKAHELGREACVVVPSVASIDNLERVLGTGRADAARRRRAVEVSGVRVGVFTPRTQPAAFDGPVLVLWADTEMVENAERLRPSAICATGWTEDGLDGWKRSWRPTDPRTGERDGEVEEVPAAVRGAVLSLSGTLGNDVLHPSDKKRAVNAFAALRIEGINADPVLVRSLAVAAGWQSAAADRLTDVARRIGEGRTVRGGDALTQKAARDLVDYFESLAAPGDC